jgi:hypothetical protein
MSALPQLDSDLMFGGHCAEAMRLHARTLGGRLGTPWMVDGGGMATL